MVLATIENLDRHAGSDPNLDIAIKWLASGAHLKLETGKHEIAGDEVFALVQRYDSKPREACRLEAHRKYADIQLLVAGRETVEVVPAAGLEVSTPYTADIEFFKDPAAVQSVTLAPGLALVLFPEDAHKPCVACGGIPEPVHKVVVKVKLAARAGGIL